MVGLKVKNGKKVREIWIDFFKGIAIIGVLMVHLGTPLRESGALLNNLCSFGKTGVQIFFIISAYLMFESFQYKDESTVKWLFKKVARLIPMFYLFLILTLIQSNFSGLGWLGDKGEEGVTLLNVFSTMLFVNVVNPYWINSCMGVNWYIAVLVPFFLCVPFLFHKIKSAKESILFSGILIPASMIGYIVLKHIPFIADENLWRSWLSFILTNMFAFSLGFALYFSQHMEIKDIYLRKLSYLCVTIILFMIIFGFVQGMIFEEIVATIFLILMLFIKKSDINFSDKNIVVIMGRYSYGIYLSHIVINSLLKEKISNMWMLFFLSALFSFFSSWILTKYYEKPVIRVMNKLINKNVIF